MGSNIITKYHYRAFKKDNGKFKQCKFVNYKMQSEKKNCFMDGILEIFKNYLYSIVVI